MLCFFFPDWTKEKKEKHNKERAIFTEVLFLYFHHTIFHPLSNRKKKKYWTDESPCFALLHKHIAKSNIYSSYVALSMYIPYWNKQIFNIKAQTRKSELNNNNNITSTSTENLQCYFLTNFPHFPTVIHMQTVLAC